MKRQTHAAAKAEADWREAAEVLRLGLESGGALDYLREHWRHHSDQEFATRVHELLTMLKVLADG